MFYEIQPQRSLRDIFDMEITMEMISLADFGYAMGQNIVQIEQKKYVIKKIKKVLKSTCQTERTMVY